MMSLRRFKVLADAYGADVQRWPKAEQADAQRMIRDSDAARAYLAGAETLDKAIYAAAAKSDAALWQDRSPEISLIRLKAGVAAEISSQEARKSAQAQTSRPQWHGDFLGSLGAQASALSLRTIEIAACGGAAIATGLWLGAGYASSLIATADQGSILSFLQPAPLHLFF